MSYNGPALSFPRLLPVVGFTLFAHGQGWRVPLCEDETVPGGTAVDILVETCETVRTQGSGGLHAAHVGFDRYSAEDCLSMGVAQCILQDHRGYLWVDAEDDLNRFDGYGFEVYRHDPREVEWRPPS